MSAHQYRSERIRTLTYIWFIAFDITAGSTQTSSVDWKLYGGFEGNGDHESCFYEAKSVTREPNGHIRVWAKCLLQKELDAIDIKKDFNGTILKNTAEKVAHYYVPPIAMVETVDVNQSMTVAMYEETANVGNIQPHSSIFYELICSERMIRELSLYIRLDGNDRSINSPRDWRYVPPEGNGARLLKILCPSR